MVYCSWWTLAHHISWMEVQSFFALSPASVHQHRMATTRNPLIVERYTLCPIKEATLFIFLISLSHVIWCHWFFCSRMPHGVWNKHVYTAPCASLFVCSYYTTCKLAPIFAAYHTALIFLQINHCLWKAKPGIFFFVFVFFCLRLLQKAWIFGFWDFCGFLVG